MIQFVHVKRTFGVRVGRVGLIITLPVFTLWRAP